MNENNKNGRLVFFIVILILFSLAVFYFLRPKNDGTEIVSVNELAGQTVTPENELQTIKETLVPAAAPVIPAEEIKQIQSTLLPETENSQPVSAEEIANLLQTLKPDNTFK